MIKTKKQSNVELAVEAIIMCIVIYGLFKGVFGIFF
jgi:hypothetical protein